MELNTQIDVALEASVSPGTLNTAIRKGLIPEPTTRLGGGRRKYYDEATMRVVVEFFRRRRERQIEDLKGKNTALDIIDEERTNP